jgi:hypothetical protein
MAVNDIRICLVSDSFVNGAGDETCLCWVGRVCTASKTPDSKDILPRWKLECATIAD